MPLEAIRRKLSRLEEEHSAGPDKFLKINAIREVRRGSLVLEGAANTDAIRNKVVAALSPTHQLSREVISRSPSAGLKAFRLEFREKNGRA